MIKLLSCVFNVKTIIIKILQICKQVEYYLSDVTPLNSPTNQSIN